MTARWRPGQVDAGSLHLAFGRTPAAAMRPVDAGTADYREIYWRVFVRNDPEWTGGGGNKFSRAIVFATPQWATAILAHVWSLTPVNVNDRLALDPASGTDPQGTLRTTSYNDFPNLRWLGAQAGPTRLFSGANLGRWHCVEAQVRLNTPAAADGTFRLWVNGALEVDKSGLNWLGAYQAYGINAIYLENYWNAGSPANQARHFDRFVVSTERIGC